jgi:hypothetical protein
LETMGQFNYNTRERGQVVKQLSFLRDTDGEKTKEAVEEYKKDI